MASKNAAGEGKLGDLHEALATVLIEALKAEGGAPAAVLAVAAKFLKDNDITCAVDDGNKMGEMKEALEQHGAPKTPESMSTLTDALNSVVSMDDYRNGTRD